MEISLLTSKCTLVPSQFFEPSKAREDLAEVTTLLESDEVSFTEIPQYGAILVFCNKADESVAKHIYDDSAGQTIVRPELYFVLRDLPSCKEYNKILCSWQDGLLSLGIAQGRSLLLANVYEAMDFTTAEYFIFLAMNSLQLNPEVSTICWRTPIGPEDEMSLYRYFKSVEVL